MKSIYQIFRKISLVCYLFAMYQLWHLCQFGGMRKHLPFLLSGMAGFLISLILWLVFKKKDTKDSTERESETTPFKVERIIFLAAAIYFGSRIVYSAIPYHGALSWKIDEWRRQKKVQLEHDNIFEDGVEGILKDLNAKLNLPGELYITDKFQVTFDETGKIKIIDTFLYGKDKSGKKKTYFVDYNADKSDEMTVWVNGKANMDFADDMRLEPMLRILEKSDYQAKVRSWAADYSGQIYEILYCGCRSFQTEEGLQYLPGDVDGDGKETGIDNFIQMRSGGEIVGFEVSLHIPEMKTVVPVRYIMEPEYVSPNVLNKENEDNQVNDAKESEGWTVDNSNGAMYFFLDDNRGWRLVVTDAAAGSRYYEMDRTVNGGTTWERINTDPFGGEIGATEGLLFFDEKFGVIGLTGASQSHSRLFITNDGGMTFRQLKLPMEQVTELPPLAKECNFTVDDYNYMEMPEKNGNKLTIKVLTEAGETEGLLFWSEDNGVTWKYAGVTVNEKIRHIM